MREIKFRGKDFDGKWVFGYFVKYLSQAYIYVVNGTDIKSIAVIPETIGQFTGLHDKNGVEIYENDFVKIIHKFNKSESVGAVVFEEFQWFVAGEYAGVVEEYYIIEVIGNIHEVEEDEI